MGTLESKYENNSNLYHYCFMISPDVEADDIEMAAARLSYAAGFGVSEWESFLGESGYRLAELARLGFGTWGAEKRIPSYYDTVAVCEATATVSS